MPNVRRRQRRAREAYEAQQAGARADAKRAEGRAKAVPDDTVTKLVPEGKGGGKGGGVPAPTAPKYGPFRQRAERDANIVYGPQIQQAQAGIQNAGTWFDQYKQDVAAANQQIVARYQAAQQAVAQQPMAQTVGLTPEAQLAAQSRAGMGQAFSNLLTAQGAAQQDYFTGRGTVGSAQQLQSRLQGQQMVGALRKERGQYTLNRRDELKDLDHRKRLESAAFGLDRARAAADIAGDAADRRADRQGDRADRRAEGQKINQWGYTNAEWRRMTPAQREAIIKQQRGYGKSPATKDGGKSPYTATQLANSRKSFRKVFQDIKKNDNGTATYGTDIRKTLTGAGADSLLVRAAWQLYSKGNVAPNVARALKRDYGITVKPRKPRTRPEPYSPPADSPGSDAAQG